MDVSCWGEKKRCVRTAQVKFNGIWGGRILCFCKYVGVVLTCVFGFLCILRSGPYRHAFIEECTGVSLCTFVVYGG